MSILGGFQEEEKSLNGTCESLCVCVCDKQTDRQIFSFFSFSHFQPFAGGGYRLGDAPEEESAYVAGEMRHSSAQDVSIFSVELKFAIVVVGPI